MLEKHTMFQVFLPFLIQKGHIEQLLIAGMIQISLLSARQAIIIAIG